MIEIILSTLSVLFVLVAVTAAAFRYGLIPILVIYAGVVGFTAFIEKFIAN